MKTTDYDPIQMLMNVSKLREVKFRFILNELASYKIMKNLLLWLICKSRALIDVEFAVKRIHKIIKKGCYTA